MLEEVVSIGEGRGPGNGGGRALRQVVDVFADPVGRPVMVADELEAVEVGGHAQAPGSFC